MRHTRTKHHGSPARSRRVSRQFEVLEDRVLLTSLPSGVVDTFSRTTISGYASNKDDGNYPVNIEITVNGQKTVLVADDYRANIISKVGSPYHAFTYTLPNLIPGNTTVLVQAVSPITGARKTLKTAILGNPAPKGKVELFTADIIAGYAFDPDSNSPIQIRVDVDGVPGTPFFTAGTRTDIQTKMKTTYSAVGFNTTGNFAGHVVEVYALDAPTNNPVLLYTNNRAPVGKVEVNDGLTISGYAADPDNFSQSIGINVTIDGVLLTGSPFTADVDRPDLIAQFNSTDHGFNIEVPGLTAGQHTVAVYAVDGQANSLAPVFLGSAKVNNGVPRGKVDANPTGSTLTGWAFDPNLGVAGATVNVYIDDQSYTSLIAQLPRPDVKALAGSPNHGFSLDLSPIGTGSHSITLTVMDDRVSDQQEIVFYDGFVNNHPPTGKFEPVVNGTMTGWAYDADGPSLSDPVDVYVDGAYYTTIIANQSRNDVDAMFPTPNHAFSAPVPNLPFGTHRIDLYAAESQGNVSVLIGSQTVKNQRSFGLIEVANQTTISGYAADLDSLGTSVQIQVYINGVKVDALTTSANLSRPELAAKKPFSAVPGYTSYGFSISLPSLGVGRNQIDVYAVDPNNGLLSPIGSAAITVPAA